jgi:hypothetical protein
MRFRRQFNLVEAGGLRTAVALGERGVGHLERIRRLAVDPQSPGARAGRVPGGRDVLRLRVLLRRVERRQRIGVLALGEAHRRRVGAPIDRVAFDEEWTILILRDLLTHDSRRFQDPPRPA